MPEGVSQCSQFWNGTLLSWRFTSTETIRLTRVGRRWGKREIIHLSLNCHHQNDSSIKIGSDESHFNVLLTVTDKVTRQSPQILTFLKRRQNRSGIEPRPFRLPQYQPYRWAKPADYCKWDTRSFARSYLVSAGD